MSALKVLFAIPELDRGGPDRVFYEIIRGLDRSRFTPSVLVGSDKGHYLSRLRSSVEVHVLGATRSLLGRYPVWSALRHIRDARPDVIVATQRMILTLGLVSPAFPRRTRLIVRQANDVSADFSALLGNSLVKHRIARHMVLRTLRDADAVICQSAAMRADLERLLGQDRPTNFHVISNPIDTQHVTERVRDARVTLPGRPALVSVGRLAPQKGYDVLLEALVAVRKAHPAVHLTILGDGPDRADLEARARTLGVSDAVTFAGFTPEPLPFVQAADLFVLASRYEGFPNAALEALACGTPIVLTDCPGANSEIVLAGENGRLASAPDAAAVAEAICTAVRELARYDRERIRANCEQRYAASTIVRAYEATISSVVDRP